MANKFRMRHGKYKPPNQATFYTTTEKWITTYCTFAHFADFGIVEPIPQHKTVKGIAVAVHQAAFQIHAFTYEVTIINPQDNPSRISGSSFTTSFLNPLRKLNTNFSDKL